MFLSSDTNTGLKKISPQKYTKHFKHCQEHTKATDCDPTQTAGEKKVIGSEGLITIRSHPKPATVWAATYFSYTSAIAEHCLM